MEIIDETTIGIYKEAITSIKEQLGRFLYIMLPPITRDCPNCRYDPITGKGSGMYSPDDPYPIDVPGPMPFQGLCPICRNEGRLQVASNPIKVKANIRWLSAEDRTVTIFGEEEFADVEIRNVPLRYEDDVEHAIHFVIDKKTVYLLKRPIPEGLRDLFKLKFYGRYEKPNAN